MARTATIHITFATVMGPIVLIMLALSLATDKWLVFKVQRNSLTNQTLALESQLKYKKVFNTRYRGLFRECFPGKGVQFPEDTKGLTDEYCLEISYNVPEEKQELYSLEYNQRIHLMRSHLAFLAIGLITYLGAFISGIAVCCSRASKWALLSTVFTYTTAFCVALAMASFHGVEFLERNKIEDKIGDIIFRKEWPRDLIQATSRSYGYSYAFGWVTMILACITGTFYAFAAWYLKGERYHDKLTFDTKSRASDFAYTNYPMVSTIPEVVYNPYEDSRPIYAYSTKNGPPAMLIDNSVRGGPAMLIDGSSRGHPLVIDGSSRGPPVVIDRSGRDMWQWNAT